MKNAYLCTLFLLLGTTLLHSQEKLADFLLDSEDHITRHGLFGDQLFFSAQENFLNTTLWCYDIGEQELTRLFSEDYIFQDMIITDSGIYILLRETGFVNTHVQLWYWTGEEANVPEQISTHSGTRGKFLAKSNDRAFFRVDQSAYTFEYNIPVSQILGSAATGVDEGILWRGSYYWIANNSTSSAVLRARPGAGVSSVALNTGFLRDLRVVGDWLIWSSESGLFRFQPGSTSEQFINFDDAGLNSVSLEDGVLFNDSTLFFSADTDETGQELWRTDGTTEGTTLFKDLVTGPNIYGFEASGSPQLMHIHEGQLHFLAFSPSYEYFHWVSDGTLNGTYPLENISESLNWKWIFSRQPITQGGYVLSVHFSDKGFEPVLFRGGVRVYDVYEGPGNGLLFDYRIVNDYVTADGTLITEAMNGEHGREPWALHPDGNISPLGDLAPASAWSKNYFIGEQNGEVFSVSGNEDQSYGVYRLSPDAPASLPDVPLAVDWLQTMSPPVVPSSSINWSYSTGLAAGNDGSWYTAGASTYGGCNLMFSKGATPIELSNICYDAYVARLNADGQPEWQLNLPASFINADLPVINTAPEGGVYAAGRYSQESFIGDITFDPALGDTYITRIDADGQALWVRQFNTSTGRVFEMETDEAGNVWLVGLYRGEARFGNLVLDSPINPSYFVAHWNAEGVLQWAKTVDPSLDWPSWGPVYATELDREGNLWLMINNIGHNYSVSCNYGTIYGLLVKLDSQGETLITEEWEGDDAWYSTDMALTEEGNVLLSGRFRGALQTGPFRITTGEINDCVVTGFVAKIDGQSGKTVRIRALAEKSIPEAILSRSDGTYTIAGYQRFDDPVSYPDFTHYPYGNKQHNIFVRVYSSSDSLLAERSFLAREEFNAGGFIYLLPGADDQLLLHGECNGPLDTLAAGQASGAFSQYVFLTSFALPYELPEQLPDDQLETDAITISPNPTTEMVFVEVDDADFNPETVLLFNALGQQLNPQLERFEGGIFTMDLSPLPKGIYYLVVQLEERLISKEIIKQ